MRRIVVSAGLFAFALAPTRTGLAAQATPQQTVSRLYHAFAWEAVIDPTKDHSPGFIDQPLAVLKRYLTDDLATLIVADRACARESHEICTLDFAPLWDSQDVAASDLRVTTGRDSTLVRVTYRHMNGTDSTVISYRLASTPDGWRIADILYSGGETLKGMLTSK